MSRVKGRKYSDAFLKELGAKLDVWIQDPNNFWLGKFALEHGLARQRLSEFAERSEKFREIYEKAKTAQEYKLVLLGLKSKSNMPIFALKNVAGWKNYTDAPETPPENKEENDPHAMLERDLKKLGIRIIKEGPSEDVPRQGQGAGDGAESPEAGVPDEPSRLDD